VRAVSPHAICALLPNLLKRPSQCILRKEALSKNREGKSGLIIMDSAKVTKSVRASKSVEDKKISCCSTVQQKMDAG
jgi:hypothetical protein